MPFCMGGMALRTFSRSHVSDKVSKVLLCDRCNTLARFSEDELHVSWQVQRSGGLHRHFV